MTYRARSIVIAVALVIVATLLVTLYVTNYKRSVQRSQEHVTVFVASKEIPVGTSGDDVAANYVKQAEVLQESVVPGSVTDKSQLAGLITAQDIFPREQISVNSFSTVAQHGLRGFLRGNVRAVQIAGNPNQTLAGTVQTGDHVDVVANVTLDSQNDIFVDRIVLRNLKVLKAPTLDPAASKLSSTADDSMSVMLAVTDTQVQKLMYVVTNEDWMLALRPVVKAEDSTESVETKKTMITDGLRPAQLRVAFGGTR
jgi:Flp pilus assembly protein CpaB